jgi:hypothetical protein
LFLVHTDQDLSNKKKEAEEPINSEFTTPQKLHAMFRGMNNMGKKLHEVTGITIYSIFSAHFFLYYVLALHLSSFLQNVSM